MEDADPASPGERMSGGGQRPWARTPAAGSSPAAGPASGDDREEPSLRARLRSSCRRRHHSWRRRAAAGGSARRRTGEPQRTTGARAARRLHDPGGQHVVVFRSCRHAWQAGSHARHLERQIRGTSQLAAEGEDCGEPGRDGSAAHPALAIQGDTVSVDLSGGRVLTTAVGPETPEQGRFPVPASSPCTFIVTFAHASGAIPLNAKAFTFVDELGHIRHPRVTVVGGRRATSTDPARQTPVSEGVRRTSNGRRRSDMGSRWRTTNRLLGLRRRDRLRGAPRSHPPGTSRPAKRSAFITGSPPRHPALSAPAPVRCTPRRTPRLRRP